MGASDLGTSRGLTDAVMDALSNVPRTLYEVCASLGDPKDARFLSSVRKTMARLDRDGHIVTVAGDDGRPLKVGGSFLFQTKLLDGVEVLAPARPKKAAVPVPVAPKPMGGDPWAGLPASQRPTPPSPSS